MKNPLKSHKVYALFLALFSILALSGCSIITLPDNTAANVSFLPGSKPGEAKFVVSNKNGETIKPSKKKPSGKVISQYKVKIIEGSCYIELCRGSVCVPYLISTADCPSNL